MRWPSRRVRPTSPEITLAVHTARCGPHATGAWMEEFGSWYFDLARGWDGGFLNGGGCFIPRMLDSLHEAGIQIKLVEIQNRSCSSEVEHL